MDIHGFPLGKCAKISTPTVIVPLFFCIYSSIYPVIFWLHFLLKASGKQVVVQLKLDELPFLDTNRLYLFISFAGYIPIHTTIFTSILTRLVALRSWNMLENQPFIDYFFPAMIVRTSAPVKDDWGSGGGCWWWDQLRDLEGDELCEWSCVRWVVQDELRKMSWVRWVEISWVGFEQGRVEWAKLCEMSCVS